MANIDIIRILTEGRHSLVVENNGEVRTFDNRGVADLYRLYKADPEFLRGANVADKIIGKGAAALMICGGVKKVFTNIISKAALELIHATDIDLQYVNEVPYIINRNHDGMCPVEKRCFDCTTPEQCIHQIESFLQSFGK